MKFGRHSAPASNIVQVFSRCSRDIAPSQPCPHEPVPGSHTPGTCFLLSHSRRRAGIGIPSVWVTLHLDLPNCPTGKEREGEENEETEDARKVHGRLGNMRALVGGKGREHWECSAWRRCSEVTLRGCRVSSCGALPNLTGPRPGQAAVADPA